MSKSIVGMLLPDRSGGHFNPDEFLKMYEKTLVEKGNRSGYKKKKSFSPSTVTYGHGACPRYWYLAFQGVEFEENIDALSLSNMENGTYSHSRIQKNIRNMGILKGEEVEILSQDPPIRGLVDVVIDWNGQDVPGEVKTCSADAFAYRQTSRKAAEYHIVQLLLYMRVLDATEGFLFYENKDTLEVLVMPVVMTQERLEAIDGILDWMREVYQAFKDENLPENRLRKNAKICKSCPVQKTCFEKGPEGSVFIPILAVPKLNG